MSKLKHALAAAAIFCCASASAQAINLRFLSAWDPTYTAVEYIADEFIEDVKKRSDGDITMTFMGPDVVPVFQQVQPVSSGVFDFLFTHGQMHIGDIGVGAAVDAIKGDPDRRRETGIWQAIDQYYQEKVNLKLIAIPTANTGYQLLMREPLKDGMANGKKIRGVPGYHNLIRSVGATPTVMAPGEIYSAAQAGIVDGTAWPAVGVIGLRWCEVMTHMVRPGFGTVSFLILMNLDKFNSLSKEQQTALLDAGVEIEKTTIGRFEEALEREDKQMIECGAKYDQQTKEWGIKANADYAEGAWGAAAQSSPDEIAALRELVEKHNMNF